MNAGGCSWPAPCREPAEPPFMGSLLRYCYEHGVEVTNNRVLMLSLTRENIRKRVIQARYDKDDYPFRPIGIAEDRAARAAEALRNAGRR